KPVVKRHPAVNVFIGETVTLTCDIQTGGSWEYHWNRSNEEIRAAAGKKTYTITDVKDSNKGPYSCKGTQSSDPKYTQSSDAVTLTVAESPKPVVIIEPDTQVFRGETVTFRCEIQRGRDTEWRYDWYKDDIALYPKHTTQEFNISSVPDSSRGKYTCRGRRHSDHQISEMSDSVTLTVSARPKPVVKIHPAVNVFIGETVTLTCDIQTGGSWKYHWNRNIKEISVAAGKKTYTITDVKDSNKGPYSCKGTQSSDPKYTQSSDAVTLTVAESPKPVVIIKPDTQVFRGETVTFRCEIQSEKDTEWTYDWYWNDDTHYTYYTEQELGISSVKDSSRGKYTCRGRRHSDNQISKTSDSVTLTVSEKPTPTVSVNPQSFIYTGDTVTLTCNLQSPGWSFSWYKIYQKSPKAQNTNPLSVIISNEGQTTYYCKARRGNYESEISAAVTVTVKARPKPVVKIHPAVNVFIGETVTLICDIQTGGSWKYHWNRSNEEIRASAGEKTYTITDVKDSNKGPYSCKGTQSSDPKYTQSSDAVTLTVAERPKPVVIITPDTHMFSGENVTFKCELQGGDTEWTYSWYKKDNRNPPFSTTQEFSRVSVTDSDSGEYTCSGRRHSDSQSSQISDPVTLTVSKKPKPELTSDLKGAALTGNSVTLSCTVNLQSAGWKFYWKKDTQSRETETETETDYYIISSVKVSDGGQYRCRAGRGNPFYYTHYSDALWVNVIESPKPVVKIQPDTHVFRNERVTFRCEFQGEGDSVWIYDWYRDDKAFYPYHTYYPHHPNHPYYPYQTAQEFSISIITDSSRGKYTCSGRRHSDNQISQTSDPVTLTVSEKPEPELTSDLKGAALTGNSVTLYCTLKLQSAGWKFYWSKDTQRRETETETNHYFIRSVSVSDGGQYRCRAGRGNPVYYTHYSDALWVNVTDKSASVSLIINPSRSQHFTAASLSLSCEDQRDSTGWTVRRYTHSETSLDCSSVSGSTCNISSLSPSHTGVYWCQSESGERSDSVNITVHNGDVILDSPVHPVTEGNPLTLHCLYRNTKISTGIDFYKNDSILQSQTTGVMTISSVSKSDEGFYHCKHPERGESPKSWISVRGSSASLSVLKLLSSAVTVSVYVLVTFILAVK
ncbi:sialoadhesin-like, partial [Silurus asotus]